MAAFPFAIGKCLYSSGVVVKQTNCIFLATSDDLK